MPRIMVVESDEVSAGMIRQWLTAEWGRVGGAADELATDLITDGQLALERAPADPPDLILLRVELPKISGYSICNKFKKNKLRYQMS